MESNELEIFMAVAQEKSIPNTLCNQLWKSPFVNQVNFSLKNQFHGIIY